MIFFSDVELGRLDRYVVVGGARRRVFRALAVRRDRLGLEIEAAMERGDGAALEALVHA